MSMIKFDTNRCNKKDTAAHQQQITGDALHIFIVQANIGLVEQGRHVCDVIKGYYLRMEELRNSTPRNLAYAERSCQDTSEHKCWEFALQRYQTCLIELKVKVNTKRSTFIIVVY